MRLNFLISLFVTVLLMLGSTTAQALLVEFEFKTFVGTTGNTPGVAIGDAVRIVVLADNGGTGLENQTWNKADILSGTLTAGTYVANYAQPGNEFGDPFFQTNSFGQVSLSNEIFAITGVGGTDNLGGTEEPFHSRNAAITSTGSAIFWDTNLSGGATDTWLARNWTVTAVAVPEPSTLGLLGLGLLGLALARRTQAA